MVAVMVATEPMVVVTVATSVMVVVLVADVDLELLTKDNPVVKGARAEVELSVSKQFVWFFHHHRHHLRS